MPTKEKISELHQAILNGNAELVLSIIDADKSIINAKEDIIYDREYNHIFYEDTPLITALRSHKPEIAKLLIERGANIKIANYKGQTPLSLSISERHKDIKYILLEKGLTIDVKDQNIINSFHQTIRNNEEQFIHLLMQKGININAKDSNGDTPLITALRSKRLDMAKFLIEQGASQTLPDNNGKTPIQYAIDEGQFEIANLLSKDKAVTLELKHRKVDQSDIGLEANFAIARKRSQPYINLTNNIYSLELLSSQDTFKKYKEIELKSLYFRTDKITLDKTLASFLTKLTDEGIKEVAIFCDKDDSTLNSDAFNHFIKENKIRINLKIAPITQEDLANIGNDSIGKRDVLGFTKLNDYKIYYQDGYSIPLLNNQVSDQIIVANHNEHKQQVAEKHQFIVQEPEYIISSDVAEEHRIKDPEQAKKNLKLEAEFQVSMNLDTNIDLQTQIDIEQEIEQENELDLPLEQLEHKYNKIEASYGSQTLAKKSFTESDIQRKFEYIYAYHLSDNIFDSDPSIQYITEKALRLVVKNRYILEHGIDINNMPIGLTLKDGIIFESMQRPKTMPINELTPRLNPLEPSIENPLEYSWLQYAIKASLTPNDLYGSDVTPRIRGQEDCPVYRSSNANTDSLDYPVSQKYLAYRVDELKQEPIYEDRINQQLIIEQKSYPTKRYRGLEFSNLSELDKKRLDDIYANLDQRGITEGFNKIIKSGSMQNGDFLLEERAAIFLEKLFKEILPFPGDKEKLEFFKKVVNDCPFDQANLEGVFEGLNGFYPRLQEFMLSQEIEGEQRLEVIDKVQKIVSVQASNGRGFQTLMDRLVKTLEHNAAKGGSLYEQLAYLESKDALLIGDPKILRAAKELEANVIHKSAKLGQGADNIYTKSVRDLAIIPPYKRANIDIYDQYYSKKLSNIDYVLGKEIYDRPFLEAANGNKQKLTELLAEHEATRQQNAQNKDYKNYQETAGIVTRNTDLITDYTIKQAQENIRLLELNMHSSSDQNYDATYPTGEFESYVSLFGTLFSDVKIDHDVKVADRTYSAGEDYNKKILTVKESVDFAAVDLEVRNKEAQHKKMIDTFDNLAKNAPEFNFGQIVALGLVANLKPESAIAVISKAKTLTQYHEQFSQFLRISLASQITSEAGITELSAKAEAISRNINFLFQEHDGKLMHEIITENGKHPENLAFFASSFAKDPEVNYEKAVNLVEQLRKIDDRTKQELLHSLSHTKLPFDQGKIIEQYYPQISVEALSNPLAIQEIISESKDLQIDYKEQSKFNDMSMDTRQNAVISLESLAQKYKITLPKELRNKNYKQIKAQIVKDKDFVQKKLLANTNDVALVKALSKDLLRTMFEGVSVHDTGFKQIVDKTTNLLFDESKTLSEQFFEIEYRKKTLDSLFGRSSDTHEKEELLDVLLADPQIPKNTLNKILVYLNEIDQQKLALKDYSISKLVKEAGNHFVSEHFEVFKLTTELFIKSATATNFKPISEQVLKLSNAKYSKFHIKKIMAYAMEHKDFRGVEILAALNGAAPNVDKIVDLLTSMTPDSLSQIDQTLGIKNLVQLQDINKIAITAKIVLESGDAISGEQYLQLTKQIKRNDLNYAKLVKSYLLSPDTANFDRAEKVKVVFDNLTTPEKIQPIFSEKKIGRFDYEPKRVKDKISQILRLNTDNLEPIPEHQQKHIYEDFSQILTQAKNYGSLDSVEILEESIKLKRERALAKDDDSEKIKQLDLQFVALSCEAMYRNTGMFPRDTQILSALNSITQQGHIIEEISTGQGKGLITALHAAYLSYTGQTVDVATSDQKLAARDLEEFTSFYDNLGIKTGNNIITVASDVSEYQKGGINYGVASDFALFRANREFYSDTAQPDLKASVSLICDEVDFTLTSEVNYKLAVALVKTTQAETRSLLQQVIEFSDTPIFKNEKVSRKDDIKNLQDFLHHKFLKYDSSYQYPLGPVQLDALQKDNRLEAKELFLLHKALEKSHKYQEDIFDKLLDSVTLAKTLERNVDYIILQENLDNKDALLQITPIIKDQPSRKTMFGDGVQAFLHLLIEKQNPELKNRFDISLPTSTVFNINPKNFIDYYRMTGGRVIGLTGTAGRSEALEEFRENNKMLAFAIPDYKTTKRIETKEAVKNSIEQEQKLKEILAEESIDRPVIIFCETPEEASILYENLSGYRKNIQLAEPSDSPAKIKQSVDRAGTNGYITITTQMLGRGTDFSTKHKGGFLGVNLCTDLTMNDLRQIEGRVARNGQEGTFISLFNQEKFGTDVESHMIQIAKAQKQKRLESQPPADLLSFFNEHNQDNQLSAIKSNELIHKIWTKLLAENKLLAEKERKSNIELRDDLVTKLEDEYPDQIPKLKEYLKELDACVPTKVGEITCQISTSYTADYVIQDDSAIPKYKISSKNYKDLDWSRVARSVQIDRVEVPNIDSDEAYKVFYNALFRANAAIMNTHAFHNQDNKFTVSTDYKLGSDQMSYVIDHKGQAQENIIVSNAPTKLFTEDNKLYYQIEKQDPLELPISYRDNDGIPEALHKRMIASLESKAPLELTTEENAIVKDYVIKQKYLKTVTVRGEGSSGTLMVDEFKKSFTSYRKFASSEEVNKIGNIVDNLANIADADISKLELGKYQAMDITTKFDDTSSHAESILTDGNFLLWANRGGGSGEEPGIKVFKITKDMDAVKRILNELKTPVSQSETRKKIYSLLQEESDQTIPKYSLIDMPAQTIGNCGWTQTESLLKAAAMVGRLGGLKEDLPDTKSRLWQQTLKDSDDIYQDWYKFDQIQRLETMLFTRDQNFKPKFLDEAQQQNINDRREILEDPISYELLKATTESFAETITNFDDTIYQQSAQELLSFMNLEVATDSEIGKALQRIDGKESAKNTLRDYQKNKDNKFEQLENIYNEIIVAKVADQAQRDQIFSSLLKEINNTPHISLIKISKSLKVALNPFNQQESIKDPIINGLLYAIKQQDPLLINVFSESLKEVSIPMKELKNAQLLAEELGDVGTAKVFKIKISREEAQIKAQSKKEKRRIAQAKAIEKEIAIEQARYNAVQETCIKALDTANTAAIIKELKTIAPNSEAGLKVIKNISFRAIEFLNEEGLKEIIKLISLDTKQGQATYNDIMKVANSKFLDHSTISPRLFAIPGETSYSINEPTQTFIGNAIADKSLSVGGVSDNNYKPSAQNDKSESPITDKKTSKRGNIDSDEIWALKKSLYGEQVSAVNAILKKYGDYTVDDLRDVKKYRAIARQVHPDKNKDATTEDVQAINDLKDKLYAKLPDNLPQNNTLNQAQSVINQASKGLQAVNTVVSAVRFVHEPSIANATSVASKAAHLSSYGANGVSTTIGLTNAAYQLSQGEYTNSAMSAAYALSSLPLAGSWAYSAVGLADAAQQAYKGEYTNAAISTAHALNPVVQTYFGGHPIGVAYSAGMLGITAYSTYQNVNSLINEVGKQSTKDDKPIDAASPKIIRNGNELHHLAYNGDINKIKEVATNNNINAPDINGSTPLHLAVLQKNIKAAETLIELGADVNITNNKGSTPLHLAAMLSNNNEVIKILLKNGAKPDEKDIIKYPQYFGEKAIIDLFKETIDSGNSKAIKNLLKNYQQLKDNYIDSDGSTLLSYAVVKGKTEIAVSLIEHDFQPQRTQTDLISTPLQTKDEVAKEIGGEILKRYNQNKLMKEVQAIGKIVRNTGAVLSDSDAITPRDSTQRRGSLISR